MIVFSNGLNGLSCGYVAAKEVDLCDRLQTIIRAVEMGLMETEQAKHWVKRLEQKELRIEQKEKQK